MKTKVVCTECEFTGTEDDLHYKKAKPWACSEDAVCPICGASVEFEHPLKQMNLSSQTKEEELFELKQQLDIRHKDRYYRSIAPSEDKNSPANKPFEMPLGLTPEEEYQFWLKNRK